MAGVYVARALGVAGFERLVAVKVLHPHLAHEEEFISMFLDEARLAARIRHPNVVPTIDISDTPDAGFYLVMEYIEGDHLGALLQRAWKLGKKLPFSVTLRIIVDALEGLGAAHNLTDEAGRPLQLVHRDVSPHNIMVSTDGVARITDFGVAKAEVRLSTTREGQFKGKLAYMAPEHASNGEADQRSDLFSMAIILWESLAGKRLFRAENQAATLNKICLEPIPMPSSVDPMLAPFDAILERGLARDPNLRYQSAEEFAEAIENCAAVSGGLAKQREVASLVREFAAEKLAKDADLIRDAISQLANNTPSEIPIGLHGEPSPPPPPMVAPPRVFAPPPAAPASSLAQPGYGGHAASASPYPIPPLPYPADRTGPFAGPPGTSPGVFPQVQEPVALLELRTHAEAGARSQSRRWIWAVMMLALAGAIGVGVIFSMQNDRVRPVPLPTTTASPSPDPTIPPPNLGTATPSIQPTLDPNVAAPEAKVPNERSGSKRPSGHGASERGEPKPDPAPEPEATKTAEPTPSTAPEPRDTAASSPANGTGNGAAPSGTSPRPRRPRDDSVPAQAPKPSFPDDLMLNPYR
jgi:serine/threonine protein kinase